MDLPGFKRIYWFEFAHRVLGRTIGTVFLLPFLYFLVRGYVRRPLVPKLAALFVLGGLQGLLGWYMVKSGLVDNPHVSQYRLTAHLGLAVLIYAWMFHIALGLWYGRANNGPVPASYKRAAVALIALISVTILSGGFVAGLKAGHAYNTFPLMDGHWIPQVMFMQEPVWRNFFENIATVQFDHRLLAVLAFLCVTILWLFSLRQSLPPQVRTGLHLLMAAAMLQVALGISTLLLHVPVRAGGHAPGRRPAAADGCAVREPENGPGGNRGAIKNPPRQSAGAGSRPVFIKGCCSRPRYYRCPHRSAAWPWGSSSGRCVSRHGRPSTT